MSTSPNRSRRRFHAELGLFLGGSLVVPLAAATAAAADGDVDASDDACDFQASFMT